MQKYVHTEVCSCRGTFMQRYVHTGTFMQMYIHAHGRSCISKSMHICVHAQVCSCTGVFMQRYIYVHLMIIYLPVPLTLITK